jgi:uncharacterized membrane protein
MDIEHTGVEVPAAGVSASLPWVMFAFCTVGLCDAFYVAQASYTGREMVCILFDGCNVVAQSPHARVFGIPLSYLGVLYYLCAASLAVFLALDPASRRRRKAALLFAAAGVAYSAFAMVVQVRFIHALCSYCLISAVITVALLAMASWHFARTPQ